MFDQKYLDSLGYCDQPFKRKSGAPVWMPFHMEKFALVSVADMNVTFSKDIDLEKLKERFISTSCMQTNRASVDEKKFEHLEIVFQYLVCMGPDFFNESLPSPFPNISSFKVDRRTIIRWFNIVPQPDMQGRNITIKRLSYCFPEKISFSLFLFFTNYQYHANREELYSLPGLFCWQGAAALIPYQYVNLQVLHQIWCLKHEMRLAKKDKNGVKQYPLTYDVIQFWLYTFKSSVLPDDRRVYLLKNGFLFTGDLKNTAVRSKYPLKRGISMIPYKKADTVKDTIERLEGKPIDAGSFHSFYSKIYQFTVDNKAENKSASRKKKIRY